MTPPSSAPRLRVYPIDGELTRFFVESAAHCDDRYLVDLAELRLAGRDPIFNGQCDCKQFECRCKPAWDADPTTPQRCKHILSAREFFVDQILDNITSQKAINHGCATR